MQVVDLDGNNYNWQLLGNISHGSNNKKSSLHLVARELLHTVYPTLQILEEVPVTLRKGEHVYLDFYIPLTKKCIEVHGEQHYKFSRFFHHNTLGFIKHQKRDREKQEWCEVNGIDYIELPFDQQDNWENILS
jgi:hypothetical protein